MFSRLILTFSFLTLTRTALAEEEPGTSAPSEPILEATETEEKVPPKTTSPTEASSNDDEQPEPTEEAEQASANDPHIEELLAKRQKALLNYSLGNVDAALTNLKLFITQCDSLGETACTNPVRAELYVALAIVLAGGKNDVTGAARLFHAALTFHPDVTVPREFATRPVQRAMWEANRSTNFETLENGQVEEPKARRAPLEKDLGTDEGLPQDNCATPPQDAPRKRKGILLLNAVGGAGGVDGLAKGALGGSLTIGALPIESEWTLAVRARAMGTTDTGIGGIGLVTGGTYGKDQTKNDFVYVLGGLSVDSFRSEVALTGQGMIGFSAGGFLVGCGVDFGGGGNGTYTLLTAHLGWGGWI